LRTYYIAGHLKQPRGPLVGQPCIKAVVLKLFEIAYHLMFF